MYEVKDTGRLADPLAGCRPRPPGVSGGRGLLLVHQFADLVRTHTTPRVTTQYALLRRHHATTKPCPTGDRTLCPAIRHGCPGSSVGPDLSSEENRARWPMLAPTATLRGVQAMFSPPW
ncbi:ATP-binding protein [Kibdelosporangium aridum]|uniref:ATP-binding protein n=1 Tax=Kibdelosporangium aridum TaxID=2030 RepID=UPI00056ACDF5